RWTGCSPSYIGFRHRPFEGRHPLARRRYVRLRQIQRKRGADAFLARHADLAAQQARDLAADGEAEAGAAVLAGGRGVGLLERLEDDALLLLGDADAGIDDAERDDARGAVECL